jgi:hypothetical protein
MPGALYQMPPAIGQDPQGFPIDLQRPKLPVPGGFQTEFSVTEQFPDGRWYNVPSIWNGKALDPRTQWPEILKNVQSQQASGWVFPNFDSLQEAEKAAVERSKFLNQLRGGGLSSINPALTPNPSPGGVLYPHSIGVRG